MYIFGKIREFNKIPAIYTTFLEGALGAHIVPQVVYIYTPFLLAWGHAVILGVFGRKRPVFFNKKDIF